MLFLAPSWVINMRPCSWCYAKLFVALGNENGFGYHNREFQSWVKPTVGTPETQLFAKEAILKHAVHAMATKCRSQIAAVRPPNSYNLKLFSTLLELFPDSQPFISIQTRYMSKA